jgi:hypothetical protein
MATRRKDLYGEDFYQWSRDQPAALRRLAAEHRNGPLDLEHPAEGNLAHYGHHNS